MCLPPVISGVLYSAVLTPTEASVKHGPFVVEGHSGELAQLTGITKK